MCKKAHSACKSRAWSLEGHIWRVRGKLIALGERALEHIGKSNANGREAFKDEPGRKWKSLPADTSEVLRTTFVFLMQAEPRF